MSQTKMSLTWESSYAIALELKALYPEINLEDVTLLQIYEWTLKLKDFEDDSALCNDEILTSIYQEWLEELIDDRY